jgi:hypothetical protein
MPNVSYHQIFTQFRALVVFRNFKGFQGIIHASMRPSQNPSPLNDDENDPTFDLEKEEENESQDDY